MQIKELTEVYKSNNSTTKSSSPMDDNAGFVQERYFKMSYAKQAWREVIQGTQDLYYCNDWEWIVKGEGFERPVRFPTLRDFTKSLVDVFMKDPPDIILRALSQQEDEVEQLIIAKKAYIDERRNSIHEKTVRRQVIEDMFFFGKGIRAVSFFNLQRGGKTYFNNTATYRIDPRHYFIDESAVKIHDTLQRTWARDTIFRDIMPLSRWLIYAKNNPKFKNIDAVIPMNFFTTYGLDYLVTNAKEVLEKTPTWVVPVYEYKNQEQNMYSIVASGVTIFESSLEEAKGTCRIPEVDYNFEPRNDSVWGNNLAQLIAPHIYLKDTIFNLEMMNLKLTLQPVVAVSGDFGYNPAVHFLQPGGVWEAGGQLNGKISDSITPIMSGNPNTKSYDALNNINSELSITTRADLRNLEFQEGKTATEVMSQNKSMNAHNETIEDISEIESEAVLFEIFLEVTAKFMNEKDDKGNMKRVKIKDYVVDRKGGVPSFIKKVGAEDSFELSEAMIEQECEVEVIDKRSQVAQNIEKMGRIMQALPLISNIAQTNPDSLQKVDFVGLISQLIEAVGLDPERSFKDMGDIYDEFEMTLEELLLGHEIDVPEDEDRKESMARLKYFTDYQTENEKDLSTKVKKAFIDHINKTMENIVKNHLDMKRAQATQAAQPPAQGGDQTAQPSQDGAQDPNAPQPPSPQGPQIPQPDARLMNISGKSPNPMQ